MIAITVSIALALDWLLGEPHRFHPLVGFGSLAQSLERYLHGNSILRGVISVLLLLVPFTVFAMLMGRLIGGVALDALLLYLALGWTSLGEHAGRVRAALLGDDLPLARQRVGFIVSRDTSGLDEEGVARATVESVLENGNDAVFGALFWFVVAGAPGVVLYRLSNTLDAMWGYRNERYNKFGWAAARLDDVLNFIPARLTASSYALVGHTRSALSCWRQQASLWDSPNAGPVMAAGAGALQVRLGGAAIYHGQLEQRPSLGCGNAVAAADIARAVQLVRHTLYLWLAVMAVGAWLIAGWQHA